MKVIIVSYVENIAMKVSYVLDQLFFQFCMNNYRMGDMHLLYRYLCCFVYEGQFEVNGENITKKTQKPGIYNPKVI